MEMVWPQRILEHPSGSTISIGDLTGSSIAMGLGNKVMAGLRVRMGINTGGAGGDVITMPTHRGVRCACPHRTWQTAHTGGLVPAPS